MSSQDIRVSQGLTAARNEAARNPTGGRHQPIAYWDEAEKPLRELMEGDALAILDCCYASAAASKGTTGEPRVYHLIAASPAGSYTSGPGKSSFTTAFCNSIEELLADSKGATFSLNQLSEKINMKRDTQPCLVWNQLREFRRTVQLGPLHQTEERHAAFKNEDPEQSTLVLRLSLRASDLGDYQIIGLAKILPQICQVAKIPLRRIDWEGMSSTIMRSSFTVEAESTVRNGNADDSAVDVAFGMIEAVRHVNTAQRFRKAVIGKRGTRISDDNMREALLYAFRVLVILFMVMAGSLFVREIGNRCAFFGFCIALVLICKLQRLRNTCTGMEETTLRKPWQGRNYDTSCTDRCLVFNS